MQVSKKSIFGLSFLCGLSLVLASVYYHRPRHTQWDKARQFAEGIYVAEEIREDDVAAIRRHGFATIIDLRPDGEAADQVPSGRIEAAARANQLNFYYVPVQHGEIPDSAVVALSAAISESREPILVYCRSGRRAARTLSLYEASRPNGPDAATILAMVRSVGQSADDLSPEIDQRISKRTRAR